MNNSESQQGGAAEVRPDGQAKAPSDLTPQIAERASEIHEERGQQNDPAVQDWEQAEKEIRRHDAKAGPKTEAEAEPKPENKTAPTSPKKKNAIIAVLMVFLVLAALAIGFGRGRSWGSSKKDQNRLVLYRNVGLRQVE